MIYQTIIDGKIRTYRDISLAFADARDYGVDEFIGMRDLPDRTFTTTYYRVVRHSGQSATFEEVSK